MTVSPAVQSGHPAMEYSTLDRDAVPHSLLAELRSLHRTRPDLLDGDLPQFGLTKLPGGRNNRVYRWSSPHGPACLKIYRTDRRNRAKCEWIALRHLAEHGVTAACSAFWYDPDPELPALGLRLVPGLPVTALTMPSEALPAIVTVLGQIRQVPLGPFANLGRLDAPHDFVHRISTWSEQLRHCPDDALTRDMTALVGDWHDRGDAVTLAEPAPLVLSHGDGNLGNWIWHDFISTIYVLDWEFAGHSDAAYDAAELIEHLSARTIHDDLWLTLLPDFGIDDEHGRRRFAAARQTVALRWLAVRWKHRHNELARFEQQWRRIQELLAANDG